MLQRAPEFRVGVTVSSLQPMYTMSGFYGLELAVAPDRCDARLAYEAEHRRDLRSVHAGLRTLGLCHLRRLYSLVHEHREQASSIRASSSQS